jgi:hypothetical protein
MLHAAEVQHLMHDGALHEHIVTPEAEVHDGLLVYPPPSAAQAALL